MTLRQFLILMSAATAFAWAALWLIVTSTDPTEAPVPVFVVFGIALFLALTGSLSIIGFTVRTMFGRDEAVISRRVVAAFRQALILSLVLTTALFLNAHSLLTLPAIVGLTIGAILLELFLMSSRIGSRN